MSEQNPLQDLKNRVSSLDERVNFLEKLLHIEPIKEQKVMTKEMPGSKMRAVSAEHEDAKGGKASFEEAMGFTWFSRVGIIALVLGVVLFLKYAFDRELINHLTRIIIGLAAGVGLMIAGEMTAKNEKYKQWAKKLVGGGFAITYFSVFAAYNFVEYREAIGISLSQDIILLSIVTMVGIILGLKDDSKVFVSCAFFLGYLNAFLGIQSQSQFLTLVYCLFLTIFLITISVYKQWRALGIGGVAATYFLFSIWSAETHPGFLMSAIFLCSYYVSFVIQSLLFKENSKDSAIVAILNSMFFYVLFYQLFFQFGYEEFRGLFVWGMAVVSFCLYLLSWRFKKELLRFAYLALAIFFLTVSTYLELDKQWITIGWALEAAFIGYLGIQLDVKLLRAASYVLAFLASFKAFFLDLDTLVGYQRLGAILVPAASFYALGFYGSVKKISKIDESLFLNLYNYYPTILVAGLLAQELDSFYISVGWACFALAVTGVGFVLKEKSLRLPGIALFALTILKVFLYDTGNLGTFGKMVSFLVLGVILLLVSFVYNKYKDKLKDIL